MSVSDSYGENFGRRLNAEATTFVTRALPRTTIAVTELRYDTPQNVLSTPPVTEDAYLVAVHLRKFPRYEYWENGKAAPVSTLLPGTTIVYDIKRQPTFHLNSAFHSVHFYLPRAALDAIADEANAQRVGELTYKPAVSHDDGLLRGVAATLLPLFRNPDQVSRLCLDHLMLAVGHHVAATYGGMTRVTRPLPGRLAPFQEKRAKDLIREKLSGTLTLEALATECGLSLSQFSKAFRNTVGTPPHRWLVEQRIAHAKTLLSEDAPLADIALACGFSDQSHFTRSFSAATGLSPGTWRRVTHG